MHLYGRNGNCSSLTVGVFATASGLPGRPRRSQPWLLKRPFCVFFWHRLAGCLSRRALLHFLSRASAFTGILIRNLGCSSFAGPLLCLSTADRSLAGCDCAVDALPPCLSTPRVSRFRRGPVQLPRLCLGQALVRPLPRTALSRPSSLRHGNRRNLSLTAGSLFLPDRFDFTESLGRLFALFFLRGLFSRSSRSLPRLA